MPKLLFLQFHPLYVLNPKILNNMSKMYLCELTHHLILFLLLKHPIKLNLIFQNQLVLMNYSTLNSSLQIMEISKNLVFIKSNFNPSSFCGNPVYYNNDLLMK